MAEQLDMFRNQPPREPMPPLDPEEPLEGDVVRVPLRSQLPDLPGETFEDIFGQIDFAGDEGAAA